MPATEDQGDAEGAIVGSSRRGSGARGRSLPSNALAAVIAALVLGLVIGAGFVALLTKGDGDPFAGRIDDTRYQAVILANDKVYFGKLEIISREYLQLHNAFFLRETRDTPDAEPVRALLPVNREIHEPDNTMMIRRSQVVLVENLAKDSPILTEIKRQNGGGK